MTAQDEKRKRALQWYLVFRIKLIEFLDIAALWELHRRGKLCPETPAHRRPKDFQDSLRTPLLSWFALFVDKNGMNVIELWKKLFPARSAEIDTAWNGMKPAWEILRTFRNKAGFHADDPVPFFNARREILSHQALIDEALGEFQKLQTAILKDESTELPDFPRAVDEFLDELESLHGHSGYNHEEFKRYLMIR